MSNPFEIIKYQLYLLQLENYELWRYWKLLINKGFFPRKSHPQRKELVWTAKARALMLMAIALHLLIVIAAGFAVLVFRPGIDNFFTAVIICGLIFLPLYFILFSVTLLILMPADALAKHLLAKKAQLKIERLKDLKIIGVAGSYGKTTMKKVLKQVLSTQYTVLSTPESVNTPVGIARFILNKVMDETQVLILELGEHYRGDIKQLCEIVKPDIAVITGINEAHLERMKTMDTIIATIFEAVSNAKPGAMVVLNGDDKNVMAHYKEFVWPDNKIERFKIEDLKIKNFDTERLGWAVEVEGMGKAFVNLLGEYALGDADAAIKIAKSLGMGNEQIIVGIKNIKPVEHRLQPIKSSGDVLVIDDSYNGNPAGAAEAVKVLSRFTDRRKIYITPGLVETGKAAAEIHREIGRQLAGAADVVILIKNSVASFIQEGINESSKYQVASIKEKQPEVVWFDTAQEAHASLSKIIKPGDVVLFQNDWGDQYI